MNANASRTFAKKKLFFIYFNKFRKKIVQKNVDFLISLFKFWINYVVEVFVVEPKRKIKCQFLKKKFFIFWKLQLFQILQTKQMQYWNFYMLVSVLDWILLIFLIEHNYMNRNNNLKNWEILKLDSIICILLPLNIMYYVMEEDQQ